MWKYVKKYLPYAILAALFMIGEVLMDLIHPDLMSRIVDEGVLGINNNSTGNLELIINLGIKMILLVLFGGFCGSMNNVFVHMTGQNIGNDIRKDCFKKIMNFSFTQIDEYSAGSLVTRVTNDITQVQNFVSQFVRGMIRTTMLTFGSMYFIYRLNITFGIVVTCAFPFVLGCLIFCLTKANPMFTKLQTQLDKINSIMQEDISGIRIIKACVREIYEKVRFGKANNKLIKTQLKILVIFSFMNPIINIIMYLVIAIILYISSYKVTNGSVTPGFVMAAITYTTQLLNGILMLVMLFQNITRGYASWKRVRQILQSEPALKDGSFDKITEEHGTIEFKNVNFSYSGTENPVLKNINFKINQGETIAIMGSTGCGKTTLISLIPRFYDVTGGEILVDGINVKEYKQKDLCDKIAFTLQKSELFSTNIEDNISWGNPDADKTAIKTAAKIAQADDFITAAPDGYSTQVAEKGMSLSGGQKQRISIARAILKPAEILIFDDSTSALDLKTEAQLYRALKESRPNSTKIIVAQRVATVKNADRIFVLDNGEIAAAGNHNDLIKNCPIYQDIYNSQMTEEE